MRVGDKIDVVCALFLKIKQRLCQFIRAEGAQQAGTVFLAYLVILAKHTAEIAPLKEYCASTPGS